MTDDALVTELFTRATTERRFQPEFMQTAVLVQDYPTKDALKGVNKWLEVTISWLDEVEPKRKLTTSQTLALTSAIANHFAARLHTYMNPFDTDD